MFRSFLTTVFLFAAGQLAHGGVLNRDMEIDHSVSMAVIADILASEQAPIRCLVQAQPDDTMQGTLINSAPSSVPPAITSTAGFFISPELSVTLLTRNALPPPNPDLDGLIKPPQSEICFC